ncbi:MAG: hypothetical protein H7070_01910 [Saprospiraceae bacterium]|nr:hypothetical protein [Pyrinomonadaceae bacterium]
MKTALFLVVIALLGLTFIAGGSTVFGQDLVSSLKNATMAAAQINKRIKAVYGTSGPERATKALDLHKISYRSTDEKGRSVVLTGLVVLPKGGAANGMVVFNHGTIFERSMSPSRYKGEANNQEAESAILAFASGGYAIVMPDYLGLGDQKREHPYPLNVLNARSGRDIIKPARALISRLNANVGDRLCITGYSEGGGVAMALVRDLEQSTDPDFQVSSSALASGPYDLSGATREFMMAPNTDQAGFAIRLYLLSYMAYYFHKQEGVKLTDYFKPSMAFAVSTAYPSGISTENLFKRLVLTGTLMKAKNSALNVITPRFRKAMETLDSSDPIVRELIKNDVYDWTPRNKMLLINLRGDTVVDPANTEKAFRTMRSRGVRADTLRRHIIKNDKLTHVTAVPEAMLQARRFFDGGFADGE